MRLLPKIIICLMNRNFFWFLTDKAYLKLRYRLIMKNKLDLKNPQTFNEKLQWLKLYDRNPEYTKMVDKYAVREYVTSKIGEGYLIPLLGAWDNVEDIDFDSLPNQFVLKCNHDSGGLAICKDKSQLNIPKVKNNLKKALKRNYYNENKEWPYKNVERKIIAEKFMVDESGIELKDYKFFCFDGKPEYMFIASGRGRNMTFDFFDMDFNHLDIRKGGHPNSESAIAKPQTFEKMKEVASVLSKGIRHVRVDFYEVSGNLYFGEITFFSGSGYSPFEPDEWDYKFGELIKLKEDFK